MSLKLYNTKTGQVEFFRPLNPDKVTLYACGPTVYDHAHVGHARASVAFDLLARHLAASGYPVDYVRNYTDVDDKIIKRAKENNQDWKELAQTYIDSFEADMEAINCQKPTHTPRATEYINDMISDVEELVALGHAYELDGDVYFDVQSYEEYGALSHRDLGDQEAGARITVNSKKKNPADFALWKSSKPGEPSWPSPWGLGRPGWHIECSTMSHRILGPEFDIHGGGQDLIFPHHENEMAQSGALGRPMARYWTHNGFVRLNNEKMSKSIGNFFTVKSVLEKFDGEALRYMLISKHYRGPLDFSDESLREAEKALERIYRALEAAEEVMGDHEMLAFSMNVTNEYRLSFKEAMDDDLNSAKAMGVVFDLVRLLNKATMAKNLEETTAIYAALKIMGDEFGLWQREPQEFFKSIGAGRFVELSAEEIENIIGLRTTARQEKNWAESDRLRDELAAKGVLLEDKAGSTTWKYA